MRSLLRWRGRGSRDGTGLHHPSNTQIPPGVPPKSPDLHPGSVRGSEHPRREGPCVPRPAAAGARLAAPRAG